MKTIAPDIQQWSCFSQEKQMDFNGLVLTINDHCILVDPPPMDAADRAAILQGRAVDYILLTNRDHVRETEVCRREFKAPVYAPEADAPLMEISIDRTYKDGERLPGGLLAIHLNDMKSPGESALLFDRGKGYLILGDSLIGKPPGQLNLLPADKFADVAKARESLTRLLAYNFDTVLVGDGISILTGGKEAVQRAVEG